MNWQSREDERVARALDGAPPQHGRDDLGVALAERIRAVAADPGLDAAPAFRDALRARLLAEGVALLPHPRHPTEPDSDPSAADPRVPAAPARRGRHSTAPARTRATRRRRTMVAAAGVLVTTLSVGTVAAGALPGDPLYGLKRRVQGVEVALARGDVDRGHRHLELARTRVREVGAAGTSGSAGPLVSTLADMDSETRTGVRLLSTVAVRRADDRRLAELTSWTSEQRTLLSDAVRMMPAPARDRAAGSLALLGDVSARVTALRSTLHCTCPAVPPADELGPRHCPDCTPAGTTSTATPVSGAVPSAGPMATAAATRPAPPAGGGTVSAPRTIPPPGRPAEPSVPAAPTVRPQPTPRPPTEPTPAPAPPNSSATPGPTTKPTPVSPDDAVTDILDGLLGAISLGG